MMGGTDNHGQARASPRVDPVAGRSRSDGGALWRLVRVCLVLIVILLVVPYLLVPLYRSVDPVSTLMLWRWATGARVERGWLPIDRIAAVLGLAVTSAEDTRFCAHHGVEFSQLREVVRGIDDLDDLAEARGGSTITQQAAKNLFLWQGPRFVAQ